MKKFFAVLLCVMLICVTVGSALASTSFAWSGSEKVNCKKWGDAAKSSGTNWHITWATGNMTSTHRAAVQIYAAPGEYASSLFVYSTKSEAYHPYNAGYGNGAKSTYIAGRMDNRDSGIITVSGTFHN